MKGQNKTKNIIICINHQKHYTKRLKDKHVRLKNKKKSISSILLQ
jgi:hypothetical protein